MNRFVASILIWPCAAALLLGQLASAGAPSKSAEFSIYTEPQRLVEVEPGRKLNLVCIGKGSPTVLFDIGVGDPAGDWALVQPQVAKLTRTCSYDRGGLGFSDLGAGGGSSAEIVVDLKRLLAAASIGPPYLLVGQSYGAMNMRLYYYLHPQEVVGLVLVEPAHEDQSEGFRMLSPRGLSRDDWNALNDPARLSREQCIAAAQRKVDPHSAEFEGCVVDPPEHLPEALKGMYLAMQHSEKFQRAQGAEERAVFAESAEQLRAHRRGFGDLPVIVLSRSAEDRPLRDWETKHLRQARYQVWLDLHRGMADASSRGEQRIVPNSDHMLMLSQPAAVVTAVRDVLASVAERFVRDPVYAAPSGLVDVGGGRRLNLYCTGTGTPVVVFESGLGDGTKAWGLVQPEIAKHTRACSYDRAGLGFSDPANDPGTSANAVRDLQALLKRAKVEPPYVLVGHSYGAMNAKLFAATNRSTIAGRGLAHSETALVSSKYFKVRVRAGHPKADSAPDPIRPEGNSQRIPQDSHCAEACAPTPEPTPGPLPFYRYG